MYIKVAKKKFKYTNIFPPLDDIQLCAYDALFCKDIKVVCLSGKAGCGKTKTALSIGIELLKSNEYEKILLLRNPITQGKEIGFFPGEKDSKMQNFMGSFYDNLPGNKFEFEELLKKGNIEIDSTSMIKGRNYNNIFIICDEAQDLLPNEILTIGTRIVDNSKLVFCSDLNQCASDKYFTNSGIQKLIEKARGQDWFAHIKLRTNGRGKIATWFGENYLNKNNII
jgi:PhoH-like ATPase